MSGVFGGKPKKTVIPEQEPIEEVSAIKQDEIVAEQQKKKKTILTAQQSGKQSTVLSGIATQLKKRLGE